MRNFFLLLKDIILVIFAILILIAFSACFEAFALFKINTFIAGGLIVVWGLSSSGYAYPIEYYSRYLDWKLGHKMKPTWRNLMVIATLLCFPIGLVLREIYYSGIKKNGEFKKYFFYFFEKEKVSLP